MIFAVLFPRLVKSQSGMAVFPNSHIYYENNLEQLGYFERLKKGSTLNGKKVLSDEFIKSNIKLKNDSSIYRNLSARINVYENALEVDYKGDVKYLPVNKIEKIQFQGKDKPYLTQNSLSSELAAPRGFYKLLYNQQSILLCHYSYKIKAATYNVQFDVGQEYDEIVIERDFYLIVGDEMIKLEKNRRKLLKQLGEEREIKEFLRKNKIDPKDEQDMVKFLEYYDSAFTSYLNG